MVNIEFSNRYQLNLHLVFLVTMNNIIWYIHIYGTAEEWVVCNGVSNTPCQHYGFLKKIVLSILCSSRISFLSIQYVCITAVPLMHWPSQISPPFLHSFICNTAAGEWAVSTCMCTHVCIHTHHKHTTSVLGIYWQIHGGDLDTFREGVKKNNYFFSSLLLLRGPATPPSPLSSPVDNLDFRSIF